MFKVQANATSVLRATGDYDYSTPGQKAAIGLIAIILSIGLLIPGVHAGCACGAAGNWDPSAFLNSGVQGTQSATTSNDAENAPRSDLFPNGQILKPLESVSSSDLVLDVSNDNSYSQSHIKGALLLPSNSLLNDDGTLKPVSELAKILGDAGVSAKDPAVIYSDNLGDATFVFWALRYLGQEDAKVLDGGLEDWIKAKLPVETLQNTRPVATYTPIMRIELLADYKNVSSKSAQVIDARPFMEFSTARIPNSISMDFTKVLENGKIKNKDALGDLFGRLAKNKPIIVYSSDYIRASILWYALQLMGYEAKIYTLQDWAANQPASEKGKTDPAGKSPSNTGRYKNLGTT